MFAYSGGFRGRVCACGMETYRMLCALLSNLKILRDRLLQHRKGFLEGQAAHAAARNRAITGL